MSGKNQFLARNNLIHILSFCVEFMAVNVFGLMLQRTDRNEVDFDIVFPAEYLLFLFITLLRRLNELVAKGDGVAVLE